jgi:hypothetical protein
MVARMKRNRTVAHRVTRAHTPSVVIMYQPEHIPERLTLTRRPSRDDREEELPQLRTEDGHVLAVVERVEPDGLLN